MNIYYVIYSILTVAMYPIFIGSFKKYNDVTSVTLGTRVAGVVLSIFWPLTLALSGVLVLLGVIGARIETVEVVGTSQVAALAWCMVQPEAPVILSDVHGRHMVKAKHAASKIRGGLSPTAFTIYEDGLWSPMEHQEVVV